MLTGPYPRPSTRETVSRLRALQTYQKAVVYRHRLLTSRRRLQPPSAAVVITKGSRHLFRFETVKDLDPDEKRVVKSVLESILIKHDAKRWMSAG